MRPKVEKRELTHESMVRVAWAAAVLERAASPCVAAVINIMNEDMPGLDQDALSLLFQVCSHDSFQRMNGILPFFNCEACRAYKEIPFLLTGERVAS